MVFTRGRYPIMISKISLISSNTMVFTRGRYHNAKEDYKYFVLIQWFLQGVDISHHPTFLMLQVLIQWFLQGVDISAVAIACFQ